MVPGAARFGPFLAIRKESSAHRICCWIQGTGRLRAVGAGPCFAAIRLVFFLLVRHNWKAAEPPPPSTRSPSAHPAPERKRSYSPVWPNYSFSSFLAALSWREKGWEGSEGLLPGRERGPSALPSPFAAHGRSPVTAGADDASSATQPSRPPPPPPWRSSRGLALGWPGLPSSIYSRVRMTSGVHQKGRIAAHEGFASLFLTHCLCLDVGQRGAVCQPLPQRGETAQWHREGSRC